MTLGGIYKDSFDLLKNNWVLILPSITGAVITNLLFLLIIISTDNSSPVSPTISMLFNFFNIFVSALTQGITISMALEATRKGRSSFISSISRTMRLIIPLTGAGVIVSVLTVLGLKLNVVPGLLVMFVFMFTFVSIIVDEVWILQALLNSAKTIKKNMKYSALTFVFLFFLGAVVTGLKRWLIRVPFVGVLVSIVIFGFFMAYFSIVLMNLYMALRKDDH